MLPMPDQNKTLQLNKNTYLSFALMPQKKKLKSTWQSRKRRCTFGIVKLLKCNLVLKINLNRTGIWYWYNIQDKKFYGVFMLLL